MITIHEYISFALRDIWDLFNLGKIDPVNKMLPLTVIPLTGTHCISKNIFLMKKNIYLNQIKRKKGTLKKHILLKLITLTKS